MNWDAFGVIFLPVPVALHQAHDLVKRLPPTALEHKNLERRVTAQR